MLTYDFTGRGSDSLYEYLYKCIRNDILAGKLQAGERLPSKRSFARNLCLSVITVENAYLQLMAEGYIYSLPKKGYFVAEIGSFRTDAPGAGSGGSGESHEPEDILYDLVASRTNPSLFPFTVWARLMRNTVSERYDDLMQPSPGGGVTELRNAIAEYLHQFRDMDVDPHQIVIGAGTEYLYGLIIQLLGFDRIYAVEDPGYRKIMQIYTSHGVECRFIPLDESGVSVSALRDSGADILHISPSHHFPTGTVTPVGRRYELLGWAAEKDSRYIIEDDFDSEFRLSGRPVPLMQTIDVTGRVIYINTFSKSLSSTIRVSYMVLPPRLADLFYSRLSFYSCTVSTFEQYTLARFIRDGYFEKHINRMRNYYRKLRNALTEAISRSRLSAQSSVSAADSGLHFLMHVSTGLTDSEICAAAVRRGIRIACLSDYQLASRQPDTGILVMNYSGLSQDDIDDFVSRLASTLPQDG